MDSLGYSGYCKRFGLRGVWGLPLTKPRSLGIQGVRLNLRREGSGIRLSAEDGPGRCRMSSLGVSAEAAASAGGREEGVGAGVGIGVVVSLLVRFIVVGFGVVRQHKE